MEIIEEEQSLGSIGQKTKHMKISRRDTIVNDLKNSTVQGLISLFIEIVSLGLVCTGLYRSYAAAGDAGYEVGVLMILALLTAIGGIILAVLGLKNRKKIRHYNEIRSIAIGAVVIAALIALYVRGAILFFRG